MTSPTIAVLGASGLIGQAIASSLSRRGFPVVAIARHLSRAQRIEFGEGAVESPVAALDVSALARLLSDHDVDVVVNCVGVLQDTRDRRTDEVHRGLVARLLEVLSSLERPVLLVHVSIPGQAEDDRTSFSRTKREAERLILASQVPFVVLRPGFVVAPAAHGGSALMRSLAALPIGLPDDIAERSFAGTAIADIVGTLAVVGNRWGDGERRWSAVWDVMERHPGSVGEVVDTFRVRFSGPRMSFRIPSWSMTLAARAGDIVAYLGWAPPVRSTALEEMRRGVEGDPAPWIEATGIEPMSLDDALSAVPPTVQERWFARLYLVKPLIVGSLVLFWLASGLIALTVGFDAAAAILIAGGFSQRMATVATVATGVVDVAIGVAIAFRTSCRAGLAIGTVVSAAYLIGATAIAPALWGDPLGALVKTIPAVVLMLVSLAILSDR